MVGLAGLHGFTEGVVDLEDGFYDAVVGVFNHANEFFKSGFGSRPLGNWEWVSELINDYFSSWSNGFLLLDADIEKPVGTGLKLAL